MSEDLFEFYGLFEGEVKKVLKELHPKFQLCGSMQEGTRLCLANELDIGVVFQALENPKAFKVEGGPFSLKKSNTMIPFMDKFFNKNKEFLYHDFKLFLLDSFSHIVNDIFSQGKLKTSNGLRVVTTNQDWECGATKCRENTCKGKMETDPDTKYEQCLDCMVAISQTKIGVCIQLEWLAGSRTTNGNSPCDNHKDLTSVISQGQEEIVNCSIDIIPECPIEEIEALELASVSNGPMLTPGLHPRGWVKCMINYIVHYKIIEELVGPDGCMIRSVVMKTINFSEGKNHYVRPAQPSVEEKFKSEELKQVYCLIKFLKKRLSLDLSNYWVKMELGKSLYQEIMGSSGDNALIDVLSQPEFRSKVDDKIDIKRSLQLSYQIYLKRS